MTQKKEGPKCQKCQTHLVPSDAFGRADEAGLWLMCPLAASEFTRDEFGFWTRSSRHPAHKGVVLEKSKKLLAKEKAERARVKAAQYPLLDADAGKRAKPAMPDVS